MRCGLTASAGGGEEQSASRQSVRYAAQFHRRMHNFIASINYPLSCGICIGSSHQLTLSRSKQILFWHFPHTALPLTTCFSVTENCEKLCLVVLPFHVLNLIRLIFLYFCLSPFGTAGRTFQQLSTICTTETRQPRRCGHILQPTDSHTHTLWNRRRKRHENLLNERVCHLFSTVRQL